MSLLLLNQEHNLQFEFYINRDCQLHVLGVMQELYDQSHSGLEEDTESDSL